MVRRELAPPALARFDGTWLGALEETESALAQAKAELPNNLVSLFLALG